MSQQPPNPEHCESGHCITCSDEGVPMTVVAIDARTGLAECVDDAGRSTDVETALLAGIEPGAQLLVHAGIAIAPLGGGAAG